MSLSLRRYCDATKEAVIYYVVAYDECHSSVEICDIKTRVASQQEMSIPRLELNLSALLLSRLIDSVAKSLQESFVFEQPTCLHRLTSISLLDCWIVGISKELKQFIQNRVTEIRRFVPVIAGTIWFDS